MSTGDPSVLKPATQKPPTQKASTRKPFAPKPAIVISSTQGQQNFRANVSAEARAVGIRRQLRVCPLSLRPALGYVSAILCLRLVHDPRSVMGPLCV